jgi:hypothetical protein
MLGILNIRTIHDKETKQTQYALLLTLSSGILTYIRF